MPLHAQVATTRRYYWLAHAGLLGVAVGATALLALHATPRPTVTPVPALAHAPVALVVPAPIVVTVPAPAPPPPPAPVLPEAPVVLHTACAADHSAVGIPVPVDAPASDQNAERRGASSPDGCTVATWTPSALSISWDGGMTFTAYDLDNGGLVSVAVTTGRVAVVTDQIALGIVHTGELKLSWHDPIAHDVTTLQVMAGGPWTAVELVKDGNRIAALTNDDGDSWTYAEPPRPFATFAGLDERGRLTAIQLSESGACRTERWSTALDHLEWRREPTADGFLLGAGGWSFSLLPDGRTPCEDHGGLVSHHAGRTLALGGVSDADFHAAARGDAAFIAVPGSDHITRVVAGRATQLPALDARVQDVDASGALIAVNGDHLYRWSPRGGWRQLWETPADEGGD